jgi:hypothetical protein
MINDCIFQKTINKLKQNSGTTSTQIAKSDPYCLKNVGRSAKHKQDTTASSVLLSKTIHQQVKTAQPECNLTKASNSLSEKNRSLPEDK